ncbi:MAG: DUF1007 family protein [Nitrosomonas sp.]|nr:DUF1007 family protein [Nitrosomonas sp.]
MIIAPINCDIAKKNVWGCLFGLLVIIPVCSGHPHNWVTVRSEFEINDSGQLASIGQIWRFDFFYSAILIAELANDWQQPLPKALELEARRMVTNLKSYGYFSALSIGGRDMALPTPNRYRLQVIKAGGQEFLELSMHFQLNQSPLLADNELSWSVYDPTYYIAYSHEGTDNIEIRHAAAWQCHKQRRLPEITEELIAYAFSLDRTQRDTNGLGRAFAEKIIIKCEPQP